MTGSNAAAGQPYGPHGSLMHAFLVPCSVLRCLTCSCNMCMLSSLAWCRAAKELLEARKKAAEEEAKQQQERRTLAILRHRQLFMQACSFAASKYCTAIRTHNQLLQVKLFSQACLIDKHCSPCTAARNKPGLETSVLVNRLWNCMASGITRLLRPRRCA